MKKFAIGWLVGLVGQKSVIAISNSICVVLLVCEQIEKIRKDRETGLVIREKGELTKRGI